MRHMTWLPLALTGLGAVGCDALSPSDPGNLVPATVAEDGSLPAIEMNGARFHVETMGNPANPVIIFLHGGPGGDYRSMLRLAERTTATASPTITSSSTGTSAAPVSRQRVDRQRSHDRSVRRRPHRHGEPLFARANRSILIGDLVGRHVRHAYINDFPQRVAGAVLIEPGPLDGVTMERIKDELNPTRLWIRVAQRPGVEQPVSVAG